MKEHHHLLTSLSACGTLSAKQIPCLLSSSSAALTFTGAGIASFSLRWLKIGIDMHLEIKVALYFLDMID